MIVDDDVWLLGTSVKDMGRGLCTIIKVGFSPETVMSMIKIKGRFFDPEEIEKNKKLDEG